MCISYVSIIVMFYYFVFTIIKPSYKVVTTRFIVGHQLVSYFEFEITEGNLTTVLMDKKCINTPEF